MASTQLATLTQSPRAQTGLGVMGLLLVLTAFGILGIVGLKAIPAYIEFYTIETTIKRIAIDPMMQTDNDRRAAFDRQMQVDYIKTLQGRDLLIGNGLITVQYEKRIPLLSNVTLLIDFDASSEH